MAGKKFNFNKKIAELKKVQSRLPALIGGIALKHFQQSFRDGGFTDVSLNAWQKRKTMNKSDRRNPRPRAILVDSGVLKNSGRVKSADWKRVVVGFYGAPYAEFHNKGLGRNPRRKFIGTSFQLNKKISSIIDEQIKKTL